MKNKKSVKSKIESYILNHHKLKVFIDYFWASILTVFTAALTAFSLKVFLAPTYDADAFSLVAGGSTGMAQLFVLIAKVIALGTNNGLNDKYADIIYSISYLVINAPLIVLAFKGISIRFGSFTLVSVLLVSLFVPLFNGVFFDNLAQFIDTHGGLLARCLFAGVCTGIASSLMYKNDISTGGFDIIAFYLSLRKSSGAGIYLVWINAAVVGSFAILSPFGGNVVWNVDPWASSIGGLFFTILYLVISSMIIDLINVRNKKVQLQIITGQKELADVLISIIPHGATILNGIGAFSKKERYIIYMVVSSLEVKNVVNVIRQIDPDSFVNATPLQQVYGRFFIKPVQ